MSSLGVCCLLFIILGFIGRIDLNVLSESNQTGSYAVIYDRYGKEIITLTPSNNSWDGTYKGALMPSNDYWFVYEAFC